MTLFLALLDHLTEPLHDSRILVGEECRTAFVQRSYLSHFPSVSSKSKRWRLSAMCALLRLMGKIAMPR